MRVLHSGSLDSSIGGPAMSTYYTLYGLRRLGVGAEIIMFPPKGPLRGTDVPIHYSASPCVPKFCYSPFLKRDMRALGPYDVYHAQGIWQYHTYAMVDVARRYDKPYLITPRGMLYPRDIVKSNAFLKRLSLKLRLLGDLNRAACVHVTCVEEMTHCRNLGITSPMAVVPNPVDIKRYPPRDTGGVFRIAYLGRLSPRKNVQALIYAFASLGKEARKAELLVIGGGDGRYERFLREEVDRLRLSNVRFTGFLTGSEKDKALSTVSVIAMPSEFENFGNVVLEGLVRQIPCIATKGAPWGELGTHRCGWWVDYSQEAITNAVRQALTTPPDELRAMGRRGLELAQSNYSIPAVAERMSQTYRWVTGQIPKPPFVHLLNEV